MISRAGGDRHALTLTRRDRRFEQLGQQPPVELQPGQYLVAPATPGDVEQQGPRRVGNLGRGTAGEPQPHVILGQHHGRNARVGLGFVAAQPQQLGRREAGQRAIAGELDQALEADPLLDLRALAAGPLVVPEDGRSQNALLIVERDKAVHLT